jgi:hypothetical protein
MMRLFDFYTLDDAQIRDTNDGYLVATPRVARTGIQLYYGSELGLTGDDAKKIMKVWRPEDEVFKTDSLATFAYKPVTDDHPPTAVEAKNWKDYAKGQMGGEIARDGDFVRVPMAVMDGPTVKKVKAGKSELSVGYDATIVFDAGTTPDGKQYDAKQTGIVVNHLAIVDAARGGAKLRIGDGIETPPKGESSTLMFIPPPVQAQVQDRQPQKDTFMRIVMIDGISVNVETEQGGQIIDRHISTLTTTVSDVKGKLAVAETQVATLTKQVSDATAQHATVLSQKDAEIVTLKKQVEDSKLTPAQIDQLVKDRAEVAGKAHVILGDKLVIDGKSVSEIQRQVVDAKLGDTAKGWSEDQVAVSFKTLTADVKAAVTTVAASGVHDTARAFSAPPAAQAPAQALIDRDKRLTDAWKGPAAQA